MTPSSVNGATYVKLFLNQLPNSELDEISRSRSRIMATVLIVIGRTMKATARRCMKTKSSAGTASLGSKDMMYLHDVCKDKSTHGSRLKYHRIEQPSGHRHMQEENSTKYFANKMSVTVSSIPTKTGSTTQKLALGYFFLNLRKLHVGVF